MLADKFRLRIEFLSEDSDIERVCRQHADFHPLLAPRLREEFLKGETEGIMLGRSGWDPTRFGFLAVIDARGSRASRAFFTAFHEITHLIIHPEQMAFPGFRRTPATEEKTKDPIESVVDHGGWPSRFYAPLFGPILDQAVRQECGLTFGCLDSIRLSTAPPPAFRRPQSRPSTWSRNPQCSCMRTSTVRRRRRALFGRPRRPSISPR